MIRSKPITSDDLHETRVTCLWDLDQFIGEEGWDHEEIEVVLLTDGNPFTTLGRLLKTELKVKGYADSDPRNFIRSISRITK